MSVSAIPPIGLQAVARYANVAPVAKTEAVRRVAPAKKDREGGKRGSGSNISAMAAPRSPEESSSSAVLTVLSELQVRG